MFLLLTTIVVAVAFLVSCGESLAIRHRGVLVAARLALGGACLLAGTTGGAVLAANLGQATLISWAAPGDTDSKPDDSGTTDSGTTTSDSVPAPTGGVGPLTVPPTTRVIRSPDLPSWVDAEPNYEGDLHTVYVGTDPFRTVRDCENDLKLRLKRATDDYIAQHLGSRLAPTLIDYSFDEIKKRLIRPGQRYDEVLTVGALGTMHELHVLLTFDSDFRDEIESAWRDIRAHNRLLQLGLGAGGLLTLLAVAFGYLRLDTATRGYYTGRLQFLSAAAILAVVTAGVVLARWLPWI